MILPRLNSKEPSHKTDSTTILIVDDEKIIRDLCKKALKGYNVLSACTCAEAMRLYESERPELVLTDMMMPGGTGIDLLRHVKKLDPNSVVIIMTGFAEKDVILNALREDADDFINKPLNILQLKTIIEKGLGKKRLKVELANLKQLDRLKSNFLSLISHKLRTPITSISLFLQNIQRGLYEPDDPAFRQNAKLIYDESAYLARLVADLLTFSQVMVGSEGLSLEACDLNSIVNEVLQQSREALNKPGIEVDIEKCDMPSLQLDRAKIFFALQQIIDNAFKFSGDAGRISISFKTGGDKIYLTVSDTGAGIPREELAKVFEKFYQIDPDNTGQVRGFGLGLFYAREFVYLHGGGISMDSEPGMGTTVTVMLPLQ